MDLRMDSLFGVQGRIALVTGGSRGIGAMIAEALTVNGAKVYICSRDKSACEACALHINTVSSRIRQRLGVSASGFSCAPGSCHPLQADLSTYAGCDALCKQLRMLETQVDILVNNAGAAWGESLETHPEHAWDKLLSLNVKAAFRLVQQLLPLLEVGATNIRPSCIINIGSINGIAVPMTDTFSYSTSKAAIHHMTRVLASKLAERNICVNAIAPGPFPSKMTKHMLEQFSDAIIADVPLHRIGHPEDMAGITLLLCSQSGNYITGTVIPVDGGTLIKANL
eukprot:gene7969-10043_t